MREASTFQLKDLSGMLLGGRVVKDQETGAVKTDREGVPIWACDLIVTEVSDEGESIRSSLTIKVPSRDSLADVVSQATVEGVSIRAWSFNGRHGVSLSGDAIRISGDNPKLAVPAKTAEGVVK